ncbi:hypothetical protein VPH35_023741 [Triticum aestivum]
MAQILVVRPPTMGHVQSSPAAELDLSVEGNLSVPVAAVGARSASSNCGDMCIEGYRPTNSCNTAAARSSGSAAHMGGSELYLVSLSSNLVVFMQRSSFRNKIVL